MKQVFNTKFSDSSFINLETLPPRHMELNITSKKITGFLFFEILKIIMGDSIVKSKSSFNISPMIISYYLIDSLEHFLAFLRLSSKIHLVYILCYLYRQHQKHLAFHCLVFIVRRVKEVSYYS